MSVWTSEAEPEWTPVGNVKGPPGPPGPPGEPGEPGDGSELPDLTLLLENALL